MQEEEKVVETSVEDEESQKATVDVIPEKKQENVVEEEDNGDDDEAFIDSLLKDLEEEDEETPDTSKEDEEERKKNKDAEEARKRRAAEAKAKADEEAKAKAEEEAKKQTTKPDEDKEENVVKLGKQLAKFKDKYPDVDLSELDKDKNFKKFIDGKLLGKHDFINLYEDYMNMRADIGGVERDVIERNYLKAKSSSGSSNSRSDVTGDIYSQEELNKLGEKMPYMSRKELAQIETKVNRSIAFYDKQK